MDQKSFAKHLRQNMTDAEHLLWRHLRAHRLLDQKFRRQQPIGSYIVDFVHFGARLIVEADGGQHNDSDRDSVRDAWLEKQGFTVLRFWNHEILQNQNTEAVLEAILKAVVNRDPSPRPLSRKGRGEANRTPESAEDPPVSKSPSPLAGEGLGRGGAH